MVEKLGRRLRFSKMHGLGNDFVLLDARSQSIRLNRDHIRRICDRHSGIGCDQMLVIEASGEAGTDIVYRIFNADGGEVEQCGNGARCVASYLRNHGFTGRDSISAQTARGVIHLYFEDYDLIRVDMGRPRFQPDEIPFQADDAASSHELEVEDTMLRISVVSMGNPHAVLRVDDVDTADVAGLGAKIERHPRFPQGVNVGFMQILDRGHIRLRVFERGVGETRACGTGACAAVVAGRRLDLLDARVDVALRGGHLRIDWDGEDGSVWMTGPAEHVFDGEIIL